MEEGEGETDEGQAAVPQTPEERGEGDEDAENDEQEGDTDESGEEETVDITSDGLRRIVHLMGLRGWTNDGGQYANELLCQEDESEQEWMDRNGTYLKGDGRCKRLYTEVHHLLKLCQGAPKFPDLHGQLEHLGRAAIEEAFNATQASIGRFVADVEKSTTKSARNADKRSAWAKKAVGSLYLRIIPLLVLCLKQAFLMGTAAAIDDVTPEEGRFMACTIQRQLVITRWIKLLYKVLRDGLESNPPWPITDSRKEKENLKSAAKNRRYFENHLDIFHGRLELAMEELKRRADAPRLRQQAMENDKRAQAAREEKERKVREARDRQMQLFAESTRRMRAAEPRDEYYEKHGWYLWEDERLLDMMRRVVWPDPHALKACVKRRSSEELKRRVDELRDMSRRKYEAIGVKPPLWCYSQGD
ncbi:Uncharacterized protein TCAP_07523 [Tolypocladium capitatum]|uniref:Uncharacterized protein n=1 Tax=Tolypocladium capitatum TaxID=45235 RepID=A0A2K3PT29_9HYPO|nr:Uncharacterized protein TCAP_07523 [Tolypocladium capitatum]